jgi:hypothetical protein
MASLGQTNPHGTMRIAVEAPFLVLSIIVICLRLYARKMKRRELEFNDYAIMVSLVCTEIFWILLTLRFRISFSSMLYILARMPVDANEGLYDCNVC